MASSGSSRGGLLTAGGILSIVGGAFEAISGAIMVGLMISGVIRRALLPHLLPGDVIGFGLSWWSIVGMAVLVLGVIAIVGGISAIRRRRFDLSLAGAICALPSGLLGILAVIFVSLSKGEFEAQK
jgi:membrane-bound ClpP family serine protease